MPLYDFQAKKPDGGAFSGTVEAPNEAAVVELLLRLENFDVTNGPDLFVHLWKHGSPSEKSDKEEGYISLGRLKGNKGNQNYIIPIDLDVSEYHSVVI